MALSEVHWKVQEERFHVRNYLKQVTCYALPSETGVHANFGDLKDQM